MNETIDPNVGPDKPRGALRSIAATERDTGISKETLRMWERRYGFPAPLRDALGERAYPAEQVARLRLLKRLLDAGHRPGRIVHLGDDDLARLAEPPAAAPPVPVPRVLGGGSDIQQCLQHVAAHDVQALRRRLAAALAGRGLAAFVTEVVAPLCSEIGEAWMRGRLEIWQEHLATEVLQGVLREGMARLPPAGPADRPRVLLATLAGEPHGLGLLMAEAMLAQAGARCVSLGVQTPSWDLVMAARATVADVVALSFTGCLAPAQVTASLVELRERLPVSVELWAGGSAPVLRRRPVEGVAAMGALEDVVPAVARWRAGSRLQM